MNLAHQCFRLALVSDNNFAEAYNNLAVLEMRRGHVEQVGQPCGPRARFPEQLLCAAVFTRNSFKASSGV